MELDVKDIMMFLYCPLLYSNYNYSVKKDIKMKYDDVIKKTINGYNVLLATSGVTIEGLKDNFGKLWLSSKRDNYLYIDSGDHRNSYENLRKKGIDSLIVFHDRNKKNTYIPLLISYDYSIKVCGITLNGTIDLVRQNKDKIEVVCYKPSSHLYRLESLPYDFEAVTMLLAYEYIFNMKPDNLIIHLLDKDKQIVCNMDTKKTINSINSIKEIIKNKLFYPANYDRCYKCTCFNKCKGGGLIEN